MDMDIRSKKQARASATHWLFVWLALVFATLSAPTYAGTVTYVYTDAQGTPLAKADANGNITATFDYAPYGAQALGTPPSGPGYTGHVNDPDTGLVYMQARYYDPMVGRFLGVDPVGPSPGNTFNFNRYDYTNNNPINQTDPDGRCSDASCGGMVAAQAAYANAHPNEPLSPIAQVGLGAMLTASGVGPAVRLVGMVRAAISLYNGSSNSPKTELVQRAMSRAEVKSTQETGLVRGGRPGAHHVSDAVNSSAGRAQQRLALDPKDRPEVRATLEVPEGRFSAPTTVQTKFNMPGGGMERTATGDVPAKIVRVDPMRQ